jgi:predicted permease
MTFRRRRTRSAADDARAQVRDELAFNAQMRARDGWTPAPAPDLENALVQIATSYRRRDRLRTLGREMAFDLGDAVRRLRRAPAFTAGTIAIVALGLGANSAVFSVANTAFLQPLPFADADRLVRVQEFSRAPDGAIRWVDGSGASLQAMKDTGAFAVSAGLSPVWTAIIGRGEAERISAGAVTAGWTEALGLRASVGRLFTADEEAQGDGATVALISDRLWHERYGGRDDVLGQTLVFDGGVRTIVGVLAPGYRFPYDEDAWWPTRVPPERRGLFLAGRLAPGVSFAEAHGRLIAQGSALLRDYPQVMHGNTPGARHIRDVLIGDEGRVVLMLSWAVALLLLIVASNVTMLFITRIVSRERELAVRAALGCGRGRQIRHLIAEALAVFAAGGVAGLGLASLAGRALILLVPHVLVEQATMASIRLDWRVLVVTTALALISGIAVGALSAWRSPGLDLTEALRASARTGSSVSGRRALGALVVAELALAALLLATAVTVGAGLRQLEARDVGFRTDDLLTWHVELSTPRLRTGGAHLALVDRISDRLATLAGPAGVGMSTVNPLCCGDWGSQMSVEGQPTTGQTANVVNWRLVTPAFFSALSLRTIAGRVFDAHDAVGSEPVVVIDERFARRYFHGASAVGQRVKRGPTDSAFPWMRIVGVVAAVEDSGDYTETWYLPYRQIPDAPSTEDLYMWLRTSDIATAAGAVRSAMREVDPSLPVLELRTMEDIKQTSLAQRRHAAVVTSAFGAAGGVLALCGVYALVAFVVARERRDMGVRLALGATSSSVLRQTMGRLLRLGAIGIVIGVGIARAVEPQVVHALEAQPLAFWPAAAALASILILVAAAAAWIPARRILTLDPTKVLGE